MTDLQSTSPVKVADHTSVYKYFDKYGVLIYVGITKRGDQRNREHASSKVWWRFVDHQEVEHFATRSQAARRERSLIQRHRPPFNSVYNPASSAAAYTSWATLADSMIGAQQVVQKTRKHLPLMVGKNRGGGLVNFITYPQHWQAARHLQMKSKGLPLQGWTGERVKAYGKVIGIDLVGPTAWINVELHTDLPATFTTACARVSFINPHEVGLKSLLIDPPILRKSMNRSGTH